MDSRERLIVALDVPAAVAAARIVEALGKAVCTYKVGVQFFTAEGPAAVRELVQSGRKVFLDLKYHDIPNTVASAVRVTADLGVDMLTVHASGGKKMLAAAVEAAREVNPNLKVLAVTVLTSLADADLPAVGIPAKVMDQVIKLAGLALAEGCSGVVASAQEAAELRRQFGNEFLIVTPGVRLAGGDHGDQSRVVTPSQAIAAGATHIVVGRPIVAASDPAQATREILDQIGHPDPVPNYSFS